jgi:hypothetical protein
MQHVVHSPPGIAHLRIVLADPQSVECTIRLTFRSAGRIIYVEQTAGHPLAAYDLAVRALLGELRSQPESADGEPA